MKILKILLGAIGLVVFSILSKMVIYFLLYAGVSGGWAWFVFFFVHLIFVAFFFLGYVYIVILDWTCYSRFAAVFAATVVSLLNAGNTFALFVNNMKTKPVLTSLEIITELLQIVFVIWMCKNAFESKKEELVSKCSTTVE